MNPKFLFLKESMILLFKVIEPWNKVKRLDEAFDIPVISFFVISAKMD